MHNWRLLLLAFLAAFQPITSFTDRSIVDGRQKCSEHRGLWDSRLSIYGTFRHAKPAEERRLNCPETREACETRRYEVRDGTPLFKTSERRVVDFRERKEVRGSLERSNRLAQVQYSRARDSRSSENSFARRSVDEWRKSVRDNDRRQRRGQQQREVTRDGLARESRDRRQHWISDRLSLVGRRSVRNDYQRSRFPLDARRDSRRNGNFLRESSRASESRNELHRTRIEVAHMESAKNREETRVSMDRARQMGREVSSRRDARLQHRERLLGRLARDESAKRSPPLNTRNNDDRSRITQETSTASRNEIRKLGGEIEMARRTRFAVDPSRETRDVRDFREERRVAREKTDRSTERFTELRSRDLSRSRTSEVKRRSRDLERRSTERDSALQRSRDLARSMNLETRFTELRRSRELGNLERPTTEQSNELHSRFQRSKDLERRPINRSTELFRSRDTAGSRNFERRSERWAEPRGSRDIARSRNLEHSSFRAERVTEERRETRRSFDRQGVDERRDTSRSYGQGHNRVQSREVRQSSDLSRRTNERLPRRAILGSQRSTRFASQRNEREIHTRPREERRTVSENRRVESRRMTDGESTPNREMESRESRSIKSNGGSVESRNTRYSVEGSNIKNLVLERDTITSRTRASVDANGNRNAWNFAQENLQIGTQNITTKWQYLLYTVQAIYLVSFLVKMFGENYSSEKKIRSQGLCATVQKLLKLE